MTPLPKPTKHTFTTLQEAAEWLAGVKGITVEEAKEKLKGIPDSVDHPLELMLVESMPVDPYSVARGLGKTTESIQKIGSSTCYGTTSARKMAMAIALANAQQLGTLLCAPDLHKLNLDVPPRGRKYKGGSKKPLFKAGENRKESLKQRRKQLRNKK